ncbi:hypothetical protein [Novosphingobium sp. KACC 22771]|uniref:hypothetical protein n=1 Tax=Novosphingobium sp. KACC 22771 TaxID=3025670 RepID=UPI0023656B22|nr:hypothetical protein [Novosphingobium sp. KACC 22771]WDF72640.1 hypothetical protein PQ467_00940 [Novosphingobium sp. KACC 22771]
MNDQNLSSREIWFRLTLAALVLQGLWLGGTFVFDLFKAGSLYYMLWLALIMIVWLVGGTLYRFRLKGGATRGDMYSLLISMLMIGLAVMIIFKS